MAQQALDSVYQKIILQRSRHPQGERRLEAADFAQKAENPLCGDQIQVSGRLAEQKKDGSQEIQLSELAFEAEACALVRASADVMVSELEGLSLKQAREKIAQVLEQLTSEEEPSHEDRAEGDLAAIFSIRQLPGRIKCACLPWEALEEALGED